MTMLEKFKRNWYKNRYDGQKKHQGWSLIRVFDNNAEEQSNLAHIATIFFENL